MFKRRTVDGCNTFSAIIICSLSDAIKNVYLPDCPVACLQSCHVFLPEAVVICLQLDEWIV